MAETPSKRLLSLDVLRGVIILTMLFVNDLAGVKGSPAWMRHAHTFDDRMTFVDLVFPAFLFMVGMSMPYAIGRRLALGDSLGRVWRHIGIRTAGLVLIGFFEVNGEAIADGGFLNPSVWYLILFAGIILIWNDYGSWKTDHPQRIRIFKGLGWLMLVLTAALYPGRSGSGFTALEPHWWGILGLIGWSYLAASLVYVPGRKRMDALLGGMAFFFVFTMALQTGFLSQWPGMQNRWNPISGCISHGGIVLAGALLGTMLQPDSQVTSVSQRVRWTLLYAAGLYAASVMLHTLKPLHVAFIISKNMATVPWCLRTSAYTALLWLVIYLLVDVWDKRKGTAYLAEAGGNALFAYLLAPLMLALIDVVFLVIGRANAYEALGMTFKVGLFRALGHAVFLTWLAGFIKRKGILLKL